MRHLLVGLRKERKMTQRQVAEKLGITRSYYGMIETGDRNPTLNLAKTIAELFRVNIEDIFFDDKSRLLQMNGKGKFLLDTNIIIALFTGDASVQKNLVEAGRQSRFTCLG